MYIVTITIWKHRNEKDDNPDPIVEEELGTFETEDEANRFLALISKVASPLSQE